MFSVCFLMFQILVFNKQVNASLNDNAMKVSGVEKYLNMFKKLIGNLKLFF